ncbi:RNA polymerase sigma factor [Egicoccus sp. AB-alg2]|uniref:RNA polymerase sigma factor n=1 Tax=Egicoccus sp. AB-alg2 TaxID=3242693 RepID=UPI00359EA840
MLQRSERDALRQLAHAELPRLYALARRLGGGDPEDLVQETLLRACRSFGSLRDVRAGPKWLTTILTNVWRDWLRHEHRVPDEVPVDDEDGFSLYRTLEEEDPFPYSDTLHVDFLGAFSEHDVHVVLQRIPPLYRAPLVLRYVEGCSVDEVARMLERPAGTVMSQLHRGRQRFERELWRYAEESGLLSGAAGEPHLQEAAP